MTTNMERPVRAVIDLDPQHERPQIIHPATDGPAPIICPVCGGENAPDAIFCGNTACHKALGDFKYVLEELSAEAKWHETLAEKVTDFIGKPHFLTVHAFWFALWVAINTG